MSEPARPIKINGFSRGLSAQQVLSYVILVAKITFFSVIIVPNYYFPAQVILSLVYYGATFGAIVSGFIATVVDPTDEVVIEQRKCERAGKVFDDTNYAYQCEYCCTSVNEESKHCRVCDRCVNDFDHHCNWINNCVSSKNYRAFIYAIIFLLFSTFIFSLSGILFTIDFYTNKVGIIDVNTLLHRAQPIQKWQPIVISILSGVTTMFFTLDIRLIIFHIHLYRNNLTTYEYVINKRQAKEGIEAEKRKKRISRSKKAKISPAPVTNNTINTPVNHDNNITFSHKADLENPQDINQDLELYRKSNRSPVSEDRAESQRGLSSVRVVKPAKERKASKEELKERPDDNKEFHEAKTGIDDTPNANAYKSTTKGRSNLVKKPKEVLKIRQEHMFKDRDRDNNPLESTTNLKSSVYASFDSPAALTRHPSNISDKTPKKVLVSGFLESQEREVLNSFTKDGCPDVSSRKESMDDNDLKGSVSACGSELQLLGVTPKDFTIDKLKAVKETEE